MIRKDAQAESVLVIGGVFEFRLWSLGSGYYCGSDEAVSGYAVRLVDRCLIDVDDV